MPRRRAVEEEPMAQAMGRVNRELSDLRYDMLCLREDIESLREQLRMLSDELAQRGRSRNA